MDEAKLCAELKKRDPFDSVEQEALLNLWRTADRLQLRFERLYREHGLTSSQYNVLRILRGQGHPLPILEIAARTITAVPGITGLIDRLEASGFVQRCRCPHDRRVIHVGLTDAGRAVLERLERPVHELHREVLGHLTPEELAGLIRLLEKARERANAPTD